jgi:hypothetical protein
MVCPLLAGMGQVPASRANAASPLNRPTWGSSPAPGHGIGDLGHQGHVVCSSSRGRMNSSTGLG